MKNISGWIIDIKKSPKGFWYTLFSENGKFQIFSYTNNSVIFDKVDIIVSEYGNTLFLKDISIEKPSELREKPSKLMFASYSSFLISYFNHGDIKEKIFFNTATDIISKQEQTLYDIDLLETLWVNAMGIGFEHNSELEIYDIICDFIGKEIPLRNSLVRQLTKLRGEISHDTA